MPKLCISVFIIACIISFSCLCHGETMNVTVDKSAGTFSITAAGAALLQGIQPEIRTTGESVAVGENGLKITKTAQTPAGDAAFSETFLTYITPDDGVSLEVVARAYHELNAVAVGYKYTSGPRPAPQNGMRFVISGIPDFAVGHASERFKLYWTRPVFLHSAEQLPAETQFMLWRRGDGLYAAMIPLVGGGMKTAFGPDNGAVAAMQSSFDASFRPDGAPVLAIAWGRDPYDTVARVYRAGMDFMGNPGRLRTEKPYPEVFKYFGWCSWNTYYKDVTEDKVIAAAQSFYENGFPLRFLLVDDGWQDTNGALLKSFGIDRGKFPSGMDGLVRALKENFGLKYVGFWHAYQGYWQGVDPASDLARKYKKNLMQTLTGMLIPHPKFEKGSPFFSDYHAAIRAAGGDMVKVDNQSSTVNFTLNRAPIGYAAAGLQDSLQASVNEHFGGAVINCMEMTVENVYFWHSSNVSRNSDDFFPDVPGNARVHVYQNSYNALWLSQLAYPDDDMFQSHHPQAEMHSVLRAVSGGPVYVTDTPGMQNWEMLWKHTFKDGRVPLPDAPALPTVDSLEHDPMNEAVPLKVFTRSGDAGMVAAFNVLGTGGPVAGAVSPADVYGLEGARFAVFEHFSKRAMPVARGESIPVTLPEYGVALYIVVPIKQHAAVFGLVNKYIAPAGIVSSEAGRGKVRATLREGGGFAAYLECKPATVMLNGEYAPNSQWSFRNGLFKMDIPDTSAQPEITIELNDATCPMPVN